MFPSVECLLLKTYILSVCRGKGSDSVNAGSDSKVVSLLEESTKRLAAQSEIGFTQPLPGIYVVLYICIINYTYVYLTYTCL